MSDEQLQAQVAGLERDLKEARAHEASLSDLLEKKLNEIFVLYHVSRSISALLHLPEILAAVTDILKKTFPFERLSLYLLDENRSHLELVYSFGFDAKENTTLSLGEGTPGRIVENGEHVHIHDLAVYYESFNDFIHYRGEVKRGGAYTGVALKTRNETIGVIGMDTSRRHGLSVDDMDFMAILSHQLAAGIEKARLFEKVRQMSQHDALTGLFNYRIFQERLTQEIQRQARTRKPLSLIMLDIDNFKRFNDTYGHQAGDEVLHELSAIMSGQSRSNSLDICCRYGGEEFMIIMPEQEYQSALAVAERIRKAVENHIFLSGEKGPENGCRVTVSLGVATIGKDENGKLESLVKQADDALYCSKRNGKNRVT